MVVSNIFYLHPIFGEDSYFDYYFSNGLVQPPTRYSLSTTILFSFFLLLVVKLQGGVETFSFRGFHFVSKNLILTSTAKADHEGKSPLLVASNKAGGWCLMAPTPTDGRVGPKLGGLWQLKDLLFSPRKLGKMNPF